YKKRSAAGNSKTKPKMTPTNKKERKAIKKKAAKIEKIIIRKIEENMYRAYLGFPSQDACSPESRTFEISFIFIFCFYLISTIQYDVRIFPMRKASPPIGIAKTSPHFRHLTSM